VLWTHHQTLPHPDLHNPHALAVRHHRATAVLALLVLLSAAALLTAATIALALGALLRLVS